MKWILLAFVVLVLIVMLRMKRSQPDKPIILDVRTREEYAQGHAQGAILVETPRPPLTPEQLETLKSKLHQIVKDLSKSTHISVYCALGKRAGIATKILQSWGYTNAVSLGGINTITKLVRNANNGESNGNNVEIQAQLRQFFKENPNPTDKMVHAFAAKQNINKHALEEQIYAMLTECIN